MAKDFRPKSRVNDREGLFAATPPLELLNNAKKRKVIFVDISKAHLYAPVQEEEFVALPPDRTKVSERGCCVRSAA